MTQFPVPDISRDALILGFGFLSSPKATMSFGGEGAEKEITPRARRALNELLAKGYAEKAKPYDQIPGREHYRGTNKDFRDAGRYYQYNPFQAELEFTLFRRIAPGEPVMMVIGTSADNHWLETDIRQALLAVDPEVVRDAVLEAYTDSRSGYALNEILDALLADCDPEALSMKAYLEEATDDYGCYMEPRLSFPNKGAALRAWAEAHVPNYELSVSAPTIEGP